MCVCVYVCLTWRRGAERVGHVCERQDGDHAVVSVGLDEVVARDGRGVNVVLPEWTDERLTSMTERGGERETKI